MTDVQDHVDPLRRAFCKGGAAVLVSVAVTGCASASGDGPKVAPALIGYQSTPKGNQRCDNCRLWQPPAACRSVSGPISPRGWCNIYAKA